MRKPAKRLSGSSISISSDQDSRVRRLRRNFTMFSALMTVTLYKSVTFLNQRLGLGQFGDTVKAKCLTLDGSEAICQFFNKNF
jgi:hypothetical protein